MVDIPILLEEKAKRHNQDLLEKVLVQLATNNRALEEEAQKQFMANITPKENKVNETFSREKMEELRLMTNMGANRR